MTILAIETSCDETAAAVVEVPRLPSTLLGINRSGQAGKGLKNPHFEILSDIIASQVKIHRPYGGVVPNLAKRAHQENLVPVLKQALKKAKLLKIQNQYQIPPKESDRSDSTGQAPYINFGKSHSFGQNQKSGTKTKVSRSCITGQADTKYQILNTILEREDILKPKVIQLLKKFRKPGIDFIAVTRGPGLAPALWPGVNFARALAYFWNKPIIGINHLEGHIAANWLTPISGIKNSEFPPEADPPLAERIKNFLFPIISLVVSGGHTQLVLMKSFGKYKLIGETRDDAAGECFDKTARILGLGYPGGPAIAQAAKQWKSQFPNPKSQINTKYQIQNTKYRIKLPRPMINSKDYDFSFSGLKTAVLYLVKEMEKSRKITDEVRAAVAAEIQQAAIDVLISKTLRAAENFRAKTIMLSGGVAANKELREQMSGAIKKQIPDTRYQIPDTKFCTDNAVMIAAAGYFQSLKKEFTDWQKLEADANLRLA